MTVFLLSLLSRISLSLVATFSHISLLSLVSTFSRISLSSASLFLRLSLSLSSLLFLTSLFLSSLLFRISLSHLSFASLFRISLSHLSFTSLLLCLPLSPSFSLVSPLSHLSFNFLLILFSPSSLPLVSVFFFQSIKATTITMTIYARSCATRREESHEITELVLPAGATCNFLIINNNSIHNQYMAAARKRFENNVILSWPTFPRHISKAI